MNGQTARNPRHLECLQMVDDPGGHCVRYAQRALSAEMRRLGLLPGRRPDLPDPEEVRRLTYHNRRENWQPPVKSKAVMGEVEQRAYRQSVVHAYLRQWGDMKANELERFGINAGAAWHYGSKLPGFRTVKRTLGKEGEFSFYVLDKREIA